MELTNSLFRECKDTGEFVAGSDIDFVAVCENRDVVKKLDKALYQLKWKTMKQTREELDYVVKTPKDVKKQAHMKTVEDEVACKVIMESVFLAGNKELYDHTLKILTDAGIPDKLLEYEKIAAKNRKRFEDKLIKRYL